SPNLDVIVQRTIRTRRSLRNIKVPLVIRVRLVCSPSTLYSEPSVLQCEVLHTRSEIFERPGRGAQLTECTTHSAARVWFHRLEHMHASPRGLRYRTVEQRRIDHVGLCSPILVLLVPLYVLRVVKVRHRSGLFENSAVPRIGGDPG